MSGINFDIYIKKTRREEKNRKRIYKTMLKHIIDQINTKLATESMIIQEIPAISLEEETYSMLEALDYIIGKLTKNINFRQILTDIKILKPNHLYLEWDISRLRKK